MKARVGVAVLVGLGLIVVGVLFMGIVRQRAAHDRVSCLNNFRELGLFAEMYDKNESVPGEAGKPASLRATVPAGTIPNPSLPVESRLSWIADALGNLSQKRQPTVALAERLDRTGAWDGERNREVSQKPLVLFLCPGAAPEHKSGEPAITQYVGLAGIGPDGATLGLGPPVPARAGCFRYDGPTPLAIIRGGDGLSSTVMFTETARDLGPWIRGGTSTLRMLDVSEGAPPAVGGQFGGNYPGVAGFGIADGGARFFTAQQHPSVIRSMMTIGGRGEDPLIGE